MSQLGQYHAEPNDTSAPGILPRRTVASSQGPAVDIPALQAVSRVLQEQSSKDAMAVPDLSELLSIREYGIVSWKACAHAFRDVQLAEALRRPIVCYRMITARHS